MNYDPQLEVAPRPIPSVNAFESLGTRYLAALSAYEDVVLLRDLLDRVDEAMELLDKYRPEYERGKVFYYVMGDPGASVMHSRLWYVEVSLGRQGEAEAALKKAVDGYAEVFADAALHRNELRQLLREQGLPDPYKVKIDIGRRRIRQLRWRRRPLGFMAPTGPRLLDTEPSGPKLHALNIPDPSAALRYWRANHRLAD